MSDFDIFVEKPKGINQKCLDSFKIGVKIEWNQTITNANMIEGISNIRWKFVGVLAECSFENNIGKKTSYSN